MCSCSWSSRSWPSSAAALLIQYSHCYNYTSKKTQEPLRLMTQLETRNFCEALGISPGGQDRLSRQLLEVLPHSLRPRIPIMRERIHRGRKKQSKGREMQAPKEEGGIKHSLLFKGTTSLTHLTQKTFGEYSQCIRHPTGS